jgi:hypothetical protein
MFYLYGNNGYANAPHYYVLRILFLLLCIVYKYKFIYTQNRSFFGGNYEEGNILSHLDNLRLQGVKNQVPSLK